MSVLVTIAGGDSHAVPVGVAGTVGALVCTICDRLALAHDAEAYDVWLEGGRRAPNVVADVEEEGEMELLSEQLDASLDDVGIAGCDEHVILRLKYKYIARSELAAVGVTTAAAAEAALWEALEAGAWGRVRQISAASLLPGMGGFIRSAMYTFPSEAVAAMLEVVSTDDIKMQHLNELLVQACKRGLARVVTQLVEKGADANTRGVGNDTALHLACASGHAAAAAALVDRGADVNARGADGHTALHWACYGNHEDVARMLLDRGADVHAKDSVGCTPRTVATSCGYEALVDLLVEATAVGQPSG